VKPKNTSSESASAQRERLLDALRRSPLTTLAAREKFGVMHPGGRVLELRRMGYEIVTHWAAETDASGCKHRIASYVLLAGVCTL
jgi:Helix-turn-helix domain